MLVILSKIYNEPKVVIEKCVLETAQIHNISVEEVVKIVMENTRGNGMQTFKPIIAGPVVYNLTSRKIAQKITKDYRHIELKVILEDFYGRFTQKRWAINKKTTANQYWQFLKFVPKDSILIYIDIGCGDGEALVAIGKEIKATQVVCCDIEDVRVDKKSEFVLMKINEPLNFADNSVNIVSIFHTLHHMIDAEFRLRDIARVLVPGGLLFLKDHDIQTREDAENVSFEHFVYSIGEGKAQIGDETRYSEIEAMYYFSERQVSGFIESLGFKRLYVNKYDNNTKTYNCVYAKKI